MRYTVIAFLMAMLCGCSMFEGSGNDCPYDDGAADCVSLTFNLLTSDALIKSRTDESGHPETASEYRRLEDGINVHDLALMVFAARAGAEDEGKMLLKITDLGESTDPSTMITGSPGYYKVTLTMAKAHLSELLGMEITPGGTDDIQLRMLILANCTPVDGIPAGTDIWESINATSYLDVIGQLSSWAYAMDNLYNSDGGDTAAGIYSNKRVNIPMFGTCSTIVTQHALYYSGPGESLDLGNVSLLRALAKVRVVDNIVTRNSEGYPKVVGARLVSSQCMLRQLPSDAANYRNGYQIHAPNLYDTDTPLNDADCVEYRLGVIPDEWSMTPEDERQGATLIGYVPEQRIDRVNNDINQGMPMFIVTVALRKKDDGSEEKREYKVPMSGYGGTKFDFGENILRNHIYTLSVEGVRSDAAVDIKARIVPWDYNRQHIEL